MGIGCNSVSDATKMCQVASINAEARSQAAQNAGVCFLIGEAVRVR